MSATPFEHSVELARKDVAAGRGPVNCTYVLAAQGKSYPRTCQRCGPFGPCPFYAAPAAAPAVPDLATENTALRSLCAELVGACAAMIRWDDAEKNARPFDEDNGAGFYARMEMCGEAFEKARAALARSKELLP